MEEGQSILLETLPGFLEHELINVNLILEHVPIGLQEVVFHRAEVTGRLERLQSSECKNVIRQILSEICQEQLLVLCQRPKAKRHRDEDRRRNDMISLLFLRTRYLSLRVKKEKILTGSATLDCLTDRAYLKSACPLEISSSLLAEIAIEIECLMDATRKQSGNVTRRHRRGFELLVQTIWDEYKATIPTILPVSEPQTPPTPPLPPDVWKNRFAQRFQQAYEESPTPEIPAPVLELEPSPTEETHPDEDGLPQLSNQDRDTEIVARLRRTVLDQEFSHLVPRADLLHNVKELLLADEGPTLISLWGTAGAGKTALLQMLGHDPEVQEYFEFPLWAELGPDEDRTRARQQEQLLLWASALALPTTSLSIVELLSQAIRQCLQGRQVLILLDDVWSADSLRPFLLGCKVIFTTRNRTLLEGTHLDHEIVDVPPMNLAEVQALVQQVAGQEVDASDPYLHQLHEQTGGLPQAVGAVVSRLGELGWDQSLQFLGDELSRLSFLEQGEGRSRSHSLRASFALSYERLRPEQQHLFRTLGALAGAPISAEAVHAVWQQRTVEATELELRRLADLGLAQAYPQANGADFFYLTGLWRDYARELLRESGGMEPFEEQYIADQVGRAEVLGKRFPTAGEAVDQVVQAFYQEMPHFDYVYRLASQCQDADPLYRLLVSCHPLLIHAALFDIWQEWLVLLESWLEQVPLSSSESQTLHAEWALQQAELGLLQGETQKTAQVLGKTRRICNRDPILKARRLLILASASLQLGQTQKTRRYLEQIQKLRCVHQDFTLRFVLQSLRARLARTNWIPSHVVWYHGQAITTCRTGGSLVTELIERLNLAESYRQLGWVEQAVDQLKHVATESGQFALANLYLTSLMQLADLHLNMGQVSEAMEVVELLRPFSSVQVLADFEARLANTPSILHSTYLRTRPERVRRIVVVGPPGSGKTALARRLSQQLGWPHVELDTLWWPSGWKPVPTEIFRECTLAALRGETWVADGNHSEVRDIVWSRADLLLLLNPDPWQMIRHMAQQIRAGITQQKRDEDEDYVARRPLIFGPNSGLLQAARTVLRIREDYRVGLSLENSKELWSRVKPLGSCQFAEYWLSEFLTTRQRWSMMKPL